MKRPFVTAALCLGLYSSVFGQSPAEYRVPRASEPPKLDGILDDQVWAQAPMPTGQWVSYNPDFSQVESDAFQVQVNQRFPLFFSEKRPFFMEGMGLFNIAGTGGDGNMRTAVHTRRIVDPIYGSS